MIFCAHRVADAGELHQIALDAEFSRPVWRHLAAAAAGFGAGLLFGLRETAGRPGEHGADENEREASAVGLDSS